MPEAAKVEKQSTVQVVTSENLAEFTAKKLGVTAPEPEKKVEAKEQTPEEKAAAEKVADEEAEKEEEVVKKQNPKIERRFSKMTEQRKTAEAAAAKAKEEARVHRERADKAEQEREELRRKYEQPAQEAGARPVRDTFANDSDYEAALEKWSGAKALKEREDADAEKRREEQQKTRVKTWNDRLTETKKIVPDFDAKIADSGVKVSNEARDAIMESEVGPRILLHLSENPEVAERIAGYTIGGMLREIGRIEARIEDKLAAEAEKKAKQQGDAKNSVLEISKAPAPIEPLKGGDAVPGSPINAKGEFQGTFAEYKAARKAGKIK